jgi:tetratricopeptide (TPR) repeat protein
MRTRLQVSAARGLTPFVGRRAEMEVLPEALARARAGRGQVVALVGDAGVGKSRLVWEFTHSGRTEGWLVLECRSVSYGKATTYLPAIDLLRGYFQIGDRDGSAQIREKVAARLAALDPTLEALLSPLLALLSVSVDDPQWAVLEPLRRREQTHDAVKRLVLRESQVQPVMLVFEDLHWIDSETQAVLDGLVASLASARILILGSYRPEYEHAWGGKSYYTQLRMNPLVSESAEELLRAVLGDADELAPLRRSLIERTGGNPFFLEESVRALVETQVLAGERGRYRLAKPLDSAQVPATVQAILAARIDRLPAERKRLLQSASVVGKDVSFALLRAIAELPEAELHEGLEDLKAAEFLYETSLFPEPEYTFKHALTHDVAYASLLHERRRALHGRMVKEIEGLYAERIEEQVERLARHALRAELWPKAVGYYRQAGSKALARSAHPEAVTCFEQALTALTHLPSTRETLEQTVDVRFHLRNSLWPLGRLEQLLDHLREAESVAESLGDRRRLGLVSAYMSQFFAWMGEHDRAVESGRRTLTIAAELGDFALEVGANFRLGQAYYALGEYRPACEVLSRNVASLVGDRARQRLGLTGLPSVLSRAWLSWCLAELGAFPEGMARAQEASQLAESVEHPFDLVVACFGVGILHLRKGDLDTAIRELEHALELCERGHVPFWFPLTSACLGSAYALSGRLPQALPLLAEAVKQHAELRLMGVHSLFVAWHGEAQLLAGQTEDALESARYAVELAVKHQERGHEAWARWLVAEIAARPERNEAKESEVAYGQAITLAEARGMRPLLARCRLGLGRLYRSLGHRDKAAESLTHAIAALRALDMQLWLAPSEVELQALG